MPTEILMPALSPTMEEGTLAKWLVKEGDTVSSGDILAEIETDKATMEFEAVDDGVIGKIMVAAGSEGVKVNTPIAVLLEDGESAADIKAPGQAQGATAIAKTPAPAAEPGPQVASAPPAPRAEGGRVFAKRSGPCANRGLRPAWPDRQGRRDGCQAGCRPCRTGHRCCARRARPSQGRRFYAHRPQRRYGRAHV